MIRVYFKQILNNYKGILETFFEFLGLLSLIYELLNIFFSDLIKKIDFNGFDFIIIIFFVGICSIIKNFPKLKRKFTIKNRDINVTIVVGDILKQEGAIIIPTNTTFDTCMEGEFVSIHSIQGQFQEKFFKNNLTELDNKIENSIKGIDVLKTLDDNRKTKTKQYECGTVADINLNNKHFYFLALADVSKNGTPKAKYDNIIKSIQGLWSFLSENKHIEKLVIPIIGTGRAGIAEATRIQVVKDIISSFVAVSVSSKITNELVVCIHPMDIKNSNVDINEIFEYTKYSCTYQFEQVDKKKHGKPLN